VDKLDVHRAWARRKGRWSPWVKPVLFASLGDDLVPEPLGAPPEWLVPGLVEPLAEAAAQGEPYRSAGDAPVGAALVVDLPGAEGALAGIALAGHGFSPIPLYNAAWGHDAVVDTRPIARALIDGAGLVRDVAEDAPPAFLLDAQRLGQGRAVLGGDFDNRSFCSPTDFPSPDTLWAAGLRRAVLVQRGAPFPAPDLAPVLLSWRERGLHLFLARADGGSGLAPLASVRPPWLTRVGHLLGRTLFMRRADGAFGGRLPLPSTG
jgi:hypothetical protein